MDNKSFKYPLAAWFLGPRAENSQTWEELLLYIFRDYIHWRRNYFPTDPVVVGRVKRRSDGYEEWVDSLTANLDDVLNDLKKHFPFHSPRYIAHMLSEQTLPSVLGYFAGMLFNPNNVTSEAAPITVELELQVGKMVATMLGYNPRRSWAHICSGGTVANLEALWVARSVQFMPFIVKEYCRKKRLNFLIKTANGNQKPIIRASTKELISLRPNESIFMLRKLAHFIYEETKHHKKEILADLNSHVRTSKFNPTQQGIGSVISQLGMKPLIFVSAAAHYSIKKAANVLGYGENAVRSVPITSRFQIDMEKLEQMIKRIEPNEYIAAVIGIVGTTEEGAVDPIHKMKFLRDEMERSNISFWIHADAAWGGYMRSLFCGVEKLPRGKGLDALCDHYVKALKIEEKFLLDVGRIRKSIEIKWANKDVYSAFLALGDADSITVDPHKMGYTPYPAGIVAFRNGLVTELIIQRAQYIADQRGGIRDIDEPSTIDAVGPYILEGSKPGAAALSCWLAHKTIPLEVHGHGKIVRTCLLNTQKLFRYLVNHRHIFRDLHELLTGSKISTHPFTFFPLYEPDTNLICFIARPMMWKSGDLLTYDTSLSLINRLNELIYAATSISDLHSKESGSSSQPFFVSRTRLEESQYDSISISGTLQMLGIQEKEYKKHGVFLLRSTIMNPWHFEAEKIGGLNYLFNFVKFLHQVTHQSLLEINKH